MTPSALRCLRYLWAGLLLALSNPLLAASEEGLSRDEQQAVEWGSKYFAAAFESHTKDRYDPELREAVLALLADYRAKMPGLAAQWTRELRKSAVPGERPSAALFHRFLAELAIWRVEPIDAEDDRRWFAAARQPQSCIADFEPLAAQALLYLQAVPKGERESALNAERERLRRFGSGRSPELHAPLRELLDDDRRAAQAIKALGVDQAAPLPPVLANLWLGEQFGLPKDLPERCAAAQWWLKLANTGANTGATAQEQLALLRYAMAPQAADAYPNADRVVRARISAGTGELARYFQVTGVVTLALGIDATGKVVKTQVVKRAVHVPGLGSLTPLAFETLLDAPASARARAANIPIPPSAHLKNGIWNVQQDYEFTLN